MLYLGDPPTFAKSFSRCQAVQDSAVAPVLAT